MYRCIRFNLYDFDSSTTISELVDEIKMSFFHRAECRISTEEYRRSENNMFVIIEVRGKKEAIEEAIKETQYEFDKKCIKSDNESWFA